MEVYERILKIVEFFEKNSQTQFAKKIGVSQGTFWGYLNPVGQLKIRKILFDKINAVYPQISRDWLYFGEGEMLKADSLESKTTSEPVTLPATPDVQAELEGLRRENVELNVELRGALKELRRLNEERRELEERLKANTIDPGPFAFDPPAESVSAGRPARGVSGADVLGQCNKN